MDLIDAYIDFCLGQWGKIALNFRANQDQNRRNIPLIALNMFINRGHTAIGRRYYKWEKPFLKDSLAIMTDRLDDMWTMFEANPDYKEEMNKSNQWLTNLKLCKRFPPKSYDDLYYAFASAEFLMLISEGKIKKRKDFLFKKVTLNLQVP